MHRVLALASIAAWPGLLTSGLYSRSEYPRHAQVIGRNLDEQVVSSLKFGADLHGHSLEQQAGDFLKRAAELTTHETLALVDRIRAKQKRRLEDDRTDLIREDRARVDARRRLLSWRESAGRHTGHR